MTTILRIAIAATIGLVALYLGFFAFTPQTSESLFRYSGYWNMAILSGAFLATFLQGGLSLVVEKFKRPEIGMLAIACLAGAAFLYSREGGGFKIVFDEQLLSNVAKSLFESHEPVLRESSLMHVASYEQVDKRPLLFPFLLSMVHSVFNYRVENAFYLNYLLTACFLCLLYSFTKRVAGQRAGTYAFLLACFMPLIEQNASSGGFEMLNLCGLLTTAWLAIRYIEKPSDQSLAQLALCLALLSHIRYESVLLAFPIACLVICQWFTQKRIHLPAIIMPLPLTFLPIAWQFNYVRTQPYYWQFSLGSESLFDLSFIPENIEHAFRFLFVPDPTYAGSPFVAIVGTCGLAMILGFSLTRRKKIYQNRPDRLVAIAVSLGIIAQTLLVLCFTYGQLDDHIVSRLGLPLVLLLIVCGAILLSSLDASWKFGRLLSVVTISSCALYAFQMYSHHNYTKQNRQHGRIEFALDFARSLPKGSYLFISGMPRIFELENYNNISTRIAKTRGPEIKRHIDLLTYDAVYVIEHGTISASAGQPAKQIIPASALGPDFQLETIKEQSLLANNFTRISRVLNYDPELSKDDPSENEENSIAGPRFKQLSRDEIVEWKLSLP